MTTIDKYRKEFAEYETVLKRMEFCDRYIFMFKNVVDWLNEELEKMETFEDHSGNLSPKDQLISHFHNFITGKDFSPFNKSHRLKPNKYGIWELKTPDLRIFGYFPERCIFLAAEIDTMERCKTFDLYAGYRDSCLRKANEKNHNILLGGYDEVF